MRASAPNAGEPITHSTGALPFDVLDDGLIEGPEKTKTP
jgi:hypothetical protein